MLQECLATHFKSSQQRVTVCITAVQVAAYEFTTLTCIPGVVHYRGAKIQMLDLPGIIEGAKDGKGRGRQASLFLQHYAVVPWLFSIDHVSCLTS